MDSEASHEADTRENKVFAVFICATVNIWIVKTLVYVWVCVSVCAVSGRLGGEWGATANVYGVYFGVMKRF